MATTDYVYLNLKRGDKRTAPGKEHLGVKDGYPVDYLDEDLIGRKVELGTQMRKAFCCVKVPRSWLSVIVPGLKCYNTEVAKHRARKIVLPFAALEAATGIKNLATDVHTTKALPIIDGTKLSPSIFKDTKTIQPGTPIEDVCAVTTGTYDIDGVGAGSNYASMAAAFADIGTPLTGTLSFRQTAVLTETAQSLMTESLDSNTFNVYCTTAHDGDPTSGQLLNANFDDSLFSMQCEGLGTVNMYDLYIKNLFTHTVNSYTSVDITGITTGFTFNLHDLLLDGNSKGKRAIENNEGNVLDFRCYNVKMWDYTNYGLVQLVGGTTNYYENITVNNCGVGGAYFGNAAGTARNIVSFGSTTDFLLTGSLDIFWNCASGDATGSEAALQNITAADEFSSLVDSSSDFLKVKAGGVCDNQGGRTVIAANTVGIAGNARPHTE